MSGDAPWYEGEQCIKCDEPLDHTGYPEDSSYVGEYGSGATYEAIADSADRGYMCLYCREHWEEHANTLVVADERGKFAEVEFNDGIMFDHGLHFRNTEPVGEVQDG